jgi:peroxiredoxin
MSVIEPGKPVPAFTLKDGLREDFEQDALENRKVIFAFFPFAFSSVCTDEFAQFENDLVDELAAADVTLYGVSTDPVPSQNAFRDQQGFSFELLSDFEPKGAASKAFGAYFEPAGMATRALVAIGDDGTIKCSWEGENPGVLPESDLVRAAISALA